MYCKYCGSFIQDGSQFCSVCGKNVEGMGANSYGGGTYCVSPGYTVPPVRGVSFGEAIANFFKNYANFSGRATRSEYWFWRLFEWLISIVWLVILIPFALSDAYVGTILWGVLMLLWSLATIVPGFAVTWRRLHDAGKSGGWFFISWVPMVGGIVLLILLCTDSALDNQYGPRKI